MTQTFFHHIAGKWHEGKGETIHSRDPGTGELIGIGQEATADQVNQAVLAAKDALFSWANTPLSQRISFIKDFEELLQENKQEFARAISEETGKPLWESQGEATAMLNKIAVSIEAYYDRSGVHQKQDGKRHLQLMHRPLGVVGVISPFNFPGHLPHGQIIPALIAGNTIVFKPSEFTPIVGEELVRLWQQVDLPEGVLNLLQGGGKVGEAVAQHPDVNGLFFTGSYETGLKLSRMYAEYPEKLLAMELGGNNPLIIGEDIHPKAAALFTAQSAYLSAGQRCTCARRLILVDGPQAEAYLEELLALIPRLRVGHYLSAPEPFMGPLIHPQAAENAMAWQKRLLDQGATPLCPMKLSKPSYLSPGLLDVSKVHNLLDREIFAPCLQLVRVPHLTQAIHVANQTKYGLAAGLISSSQEDYMQFSRDIRAGVISWNSPMTGASGKVPFGGIGCSGNFRPGGYYTTDFCTYPMVATESARLVTPTYLPGLN